MKLLTEPLNYKALHNMLDLLDGNIARIMVSDDVEEIMSAVGFADERLHMIAYSRIKELLAREKGD